jgi:hypothetical protein
LGKILQSDYDFTYNNTRGAVFQGGLGKNLNFYTVVFESQGRFADYYNQYAESIAPYMGSGVAIIPGRGIAKNLWMAAMITRWQRVIFPTTHQNFLIFNWGTVIIL